jgi:cellobiose phosphorylase
MATHWILGVRPEADGLRVDPSIPAEWADYRVTRIFRGARYNIHVSNPQHVTRGVKSITVDGRRLPSAVIPAFADGQTHTVEVVLGVTQDSQ